MPDPGDPVVTMICESPKHDTMLIADHIPQSYLWIIPNSVIPLIHFKDVFNETIDHFLLILIEKIENSEGLIEIKLTT